MSDRWQHVEQLYHAALERTEAERAAYLQDACAGDDALRKEVESLLLQEKGAKSFLDVPAMDVAAHTFDENPSQSMIGRQMGSYRVVSLLGSGGMGEVYQAQDTKLRRDVAIKVLPAAFLMDPERLSRLQREARILASLNHPNIATIHGLEQSDGVNYLVMEMVSGKTLAELIETGPMKVEEALKVASQIAEALEAAHEKGVVHRDLKPANVKLTPEGRVKVLDFGLAKAFAGDSGLDLSNDPTLTGLATQEGRILGTPSYMSPEQARGKVVDKRTDIWAFGCVLYEMLTGQQAFPGDTVSDSLAAVLERDPYWQALPAAIPTKIRQLLQRCLQKDVHRRLRDLGDARLELEELSETPPLLPMRVPWWRSSSVSGIAVFALLALAAGAGWDYYRLRIGGGQMIDSVAVLPFANGSGDPNMEYLSDGITENLIDNLSQLPNLKVMSRDSSFRYKGKEIDAQTAGRALGVRGILKGRVVKVGEKLSVSVELIDAGQNRELWGHQYNRNVADILAFQEELAGEIVTTLRMHLSGEEQNVMAKRNTTDPLAYELYLQGKYFWVKANRDDWFKAIDFFQRAIDRDPNYALASLALSETWGALGSFGLVAADEAYPKAKEGTLKALELDPTVADAHAELAFVMAEYDWDWAGSEKERQKAIELSPTDSGEEHYGLAMEMREVGKLDDAIAEHTRSVELDPLSLISRTALGTTLYMARRSDDAIGEFRKTLELEPNFTPATSALGYAYLQKNMNQEAIEQFEKVLQLNPRNAEGRSNLGYAYAVAGRREDAQIKLNELNELAKQQYVPAVYRAVIYIGLGEKEKAFEWLERAVNERFVGGPRGAIKVNPIYDPLRTDPRFRNLLRRMRLLT